MPVVDLVKRNRSYRRFDEANRISKETLSELIELTRFCASTANGQSLKFAPAWKPGDCNRIFPSLNWAGNLTDWPGPAEGERPAAYIVVLGDHEIKPSFGIDPGIVAQTILLAATERGYGGCMIASIRKDDLHKEMNLPDRFEILLVIALGKPAETVVIEETGSDGDVKYYRDENDVHHVPKRPLEEIIVEAGF